MLKIGIVEILTEIHIHNPLACASPQAEDRLRKIKEFIEMVEDNTKMPHQHTDPQLRLYCLAERAREILGEGQ